MTSYPLNFPAVGVTDSRFRLMRVVSKTESPFTLSQQVALFPGEAWAGEVTFRPMTYAQAGAVKAFIAKLAGSYGTFMYGDPDYLARGPIGTPVDVLTSTNEVRNGQATGAVNGVIGSGGALPTNWTRTGSGGLTWEIIGSGTDANGIGYVDIKFSGITSATTFSIRTEGVTQISAAFGQNWTGTAYAALVSGSLTNITSTQITLNERDGAGASLVSGTTTYTPTGIFTRVTRTRALSNAAVAKLTTDYVFNFTSGVSVDATFRLGGVQQEQQLTATPYIPTSGVAAARPAGITVRGAGQTGNILNVQGFESDKIGRLKAGDYFQLGSGAAAQLYQVTEDANSNASGYATLVFEPPIRTAPADGAVLTITGAKCAFRLIEDADVASDRNAVCSVTLRFQQDKF